MAVTGTIEIKGAAALEKELLQFADKVRKRILGRAMRAAMWPIYAAAVRLVPEKTGKLADSIRIGRIRTKGGQMTSMVIAGGEGGHLFKGDQFYGGFVEFGHFLGKRDRAIERNINRVRATRRRQGSELEVLDAQAMRFLQGDTRKFVPAQPFMRPAFDEKKDEAVAILEREIRVGIDREWSRINKAVASSAA